MVVVNSPCGRVWHVPILKVREDYARFLVDADGVTMEAAMEKSTPEFAGTWFAEQYIWAEVERDGVLVRDADAEQIKEALDFLRAFSDSGPGACMAQRTEGGQG